MSNYLPKGVVIIEQASHDLKNVPLIFQNHIHAINMNDSNSIMSCSTPIYSVANTLKDISLGGPLWDGFISEYYNENNDTSIILFQKNTASYVDNSYHPSVGN